MVKAATKSITLAVTHTHSPVSALKTPEHGAFAPYSTQYQLDQQAQ
jgi:hypothetical protein